MEIINMPIKDIVVYKNNAKRHDKKQIDAIAKSIEDFGFQQPIVLDENSTIIVGHGRYQAAKKLRFKSVPCVYATDLTPEQVRAIYDKSPLIMSNYSKDMYFGMLQEYGITEVTGYEEPGSFNKYYGYFAIDNQY
jgi:hypothetical protein